MRILLLGGYGGFGGRLAVRLTCAGHIVIVAGRSLTKAQKFCRDLPGTEALAADRTRDLAPIFTEVRPDVVIDAAGPFQSSGYAVVEACIAARVTYLDLADARDFVGGIGRYDSAARAACIAVLAGASSVPALSGAVARHLAQGLDRVTAVEIAISASSRAAAGRSVATAILDGVGQAMRVCKGARWVTRFGWQDLHAVPFALPGRAAFRRLVARADVPDLDLLVARLSGNPSVGFFAGTESRLANLALWLASWPVRWRWLASLAGLAPLLLPLQRMTSLWGGDTSGMVVRLFGTRGDRRLERRWTLVATNGDGPEIPILAAAALVERLAALEPGARDAGEALELADFKPAFASLAIEHATVEIAQPPALYRRVMGDDFDALAPQVRAMHEVLRDGGASGQAAVERGRNPLARLVASAMRFPRAGEHALHVGFAERDGVETWTRDFAGRCFQSRLSARGKHLVERFGPLRFAFRLPVADGGLTMVMTHWSAFGVPLPLAIAPHSLAREWEEDGKFCFDVPIDLPLVGRVVRYRGWLSAPLT